jgi:hypothetical protein
VHPCRGPDIQKFIHGAETIVFHDAAYILWAEHETWRYPIQGVRPRRDWPGLPNRKLRRHAKIRVLRSVS